MEKKELLLKVHRSRKLYLPFYFLGILILLSLGYSYYMSNEISTKILVIAIVSVILIIKLSEIHRIRDWWGITQNSFIQSKSILNKNVREISFASIADLSLNQPLYKRILNFGTVEIRKFSNEMSTIVPNINNPEKFINIIRDAIKNKGVTKDEKGSFSVS